MSLKLALCLIRDIELGFFVNVTRILSSSLLSLLDGEVQAGDPLLSHKVFFCWKNQPSIVFCEKLTTLQRLRALNLCRSRLIMLFSFVLVALYHLICYQLIMLHSFVNFLFQKVPLIITTQPILFEAISDNDFKGIVSEVLCLAFLLP